MCFGVNKLLLGYSTTVTAVFGAYFKLQTFVYMAVFGLNHLHTDFSKRMQETLFNLSVYG
jgi:hypothetical protein